jgi:hypothetical protein
MISVSVTINMNNCNKTLSIEQAILLRDGLIDALDGIEYTKKNIAPNVVDYSNDNDSNSSTNDDEQNSNNTIDPTDYFNENNKNNYHPDVVAAKEKARRASKCCGGK